MFKIDKNIPLPDFHGVGRARKYPWPEMGIGDSFLIIDYPKDKRGCASNSCCGANLRYAPKKFVQKLTEEGLRIWRVK